MLVEALVGLVQVGFGESMIPRSLWTGQGSRRGRGRPPPPPILLWIPGGCVALDFVQKVEAHRVCGVSLGPGAVLGLGVQW